MMQQETGDGKTGTQKDMEVARSNRAATPGEGQRPRKIGRPHRQSMAEGTLDWNPTQWLASSPLVRPKRVEAG
jgi:hypothetical protein